MPRHKTKQNTLEMILFVLVNMINILDANRNNLGKCRSMHQMHATREKYSLHAYGMCYMYLFFQKRVQMLNESYPILITDKYGQYIHLSQDFKNATSRTIICQTLSSDECQRWISCCQEADACCERQLSIPDGKKLLCPRIWDGFTCFDDTAPGTESYRNCPKFLRFSNPTHQSVKTCLPNGTWIQKTLYTPCFYVNALSIFIGLGSSIVSIVFLAPAIVIFMSYKQLRKQHRIRLHVNFFLALLLKETMTAIWDMEVTYEYIKSDTVMMEHGIGCTLLSFAKIYFNCCGFTWMFCEGFYLHRLMSNAFSPPRSIVHMYIGGWVFPLLTCLVYSVIRGIYANESCWAFPFNNLEWIFDAPNLLFLVMNVVFLCNIMRILLTQVQSHPNEPGTFRRAVKAMLVLIPLFGVQLFITIYRIPTTEQGGIEYERFSFLVRNLQGFFVALVFCFLNGEVFSHLRRTFRHRIRDRFSTLHRINHTTNQTISMRSDCDDIRLSNTNTSLINGREKRKDGHPIEQNNGDCHEFSKKSDGLNQESIPLTD